MTEEFLQYIWKHKLYESKPYLANTGEQILILFPGEQNHDSGPDFRDVRIKINNTLWAGNCEVHLAASDWFKHNHHTDKSYDSVVLHIVLKNDIEITASNGRTIPTIELKYQHKLEENYQNLLSSQLWVPCAEKIGKVDRFHIIQWLTSLAIERLEKRSTEIEYHLNQNKNNWEEAFYHFLARSFGFKVNALPFELLAKSLPLNILAKHKDNLFQLEALLFGQSGLLKNSSDDYSKKLLNEYLFYQKKYSLKPLEGHLWKFMRLRPANFPTIRIAQFAALVHKSSGLFSKILEPDKIDVLDSFFKVKSSEYWNGHYNFGKQSATKTKNMSPASIHLLLLNAVIPFIFIYGKNKNIIAYKDKAIAFLEALPAENNNIIGHWKKIGINVNNAFESQALLQLRNEYCQEKKCLNCNIGNYLIANKQ